MENVSLDQLIHSYFYRFLNLVLGQSAGAMLASHLLTTPLMQPGVDPELPTIRGIIGLSGNALSPLSTCTDPMTHHRRLANATGCDFETAEKIRECMATKSVAELVAGMSEYSVIFLIQEGCVVFTYWVHDF